jgi:hypothetical protein
MGLELFLFRDSNFWPDFPVSAEKALELYNYGIDDSPALDGAIAIDQWFVQAIVAALGTVDVPDLDTQVNGRNVIRQMQEEWGTGEDAEVDREWFQNRKSFMGSIVAAIQDKVFSDPTSFDATELLLAVVQSAEEKHLQIYLRDEPAAEVVADMGWDGALRPPVDADFLLALDTNMGFNKVNFVLNRSLTYAVTLANDGSATSELDLAYEHTVAASGQPCNQLSNYQGTVLYESLFDLCYWNYLRLYTPAGSQLLDATRHIVPPEDFWTGRGWDGVADSAESEADLAVFDNFLLVKQGETLHSRYQFQLPSSVTRDLENGQRQYNLLLAKQAGSRPQPARVTVTLPAGAQLVAVEPAPVSVDDGVVVFDVELDRDTQFTVTFQ